MSGVVTTDWRNAEEPLGLPVRPSSRLVQRIEPRTRIILAAAFAGTVVSLKDPWLLLAAVALALALAAFARLPARRTAKRLAGMDTFMVPILLFLPFTVPGEAAFTLASLPASVEGIARALAIVLTANAVTLALMALIGTIEPATLGHSLQRLGAPAKVVSLLLVTVRYVSVLENEYRRLRLAMKARAFRPAGNLHTWRTMGYLFGMLLVRSFERSERIVAAMKCRGFAGRYVFPDAPAPGWLDAAFAAAVVAALGALITAGIR